jgi:hypothetical protein
VESAKRFSLQLPYGYSGVLWQADGPETEHHGEGVRAYCDNSDLHTLVRLMTGGAGMIVAMRKDRGEVITADTCEWIMGLSRNDPTTSGRAQHSRSPARRHYQLQYVGGYGFVNESWGPHLERPRYNLHQDCGRPAQYIIHLWLRVGPA